MGSARKDQLLAFTGCLLLALEAGAGTFTVRVPDLEGPYEFPAYDVYSGLAPEGAERRVVFEAPFAADGITGARLRITGWAAPGRVAGDGVIREAREIPAQTGCHGFADVGGSLWRGTAVLPEGSFSVVVVLDIAGVQGGAPGVPPVRMEVGGLIFPYVDVSGLPPYLPAYLNGEVVPLPWYDGLVVTVPCTATVTEAYLVLEGAAIPEPAALALLAAGAAGAFALRRPRFWPLRQAKPADLRRGEGP